MYISSQKNSRPSWTVWLINPSLCNKRVSEMRAPLEARRSIKRIRLMSPLHQWLAFEANVTKVHCTFCEKVSSKLNNPKAVKWGIRWMDLFDTWQIESLTASCNSLWRNHYHFVMYNLTHWGRDKIDAILQTTFSNACSWMKMYEFRLKYYRNLFLRV